MRRSLLFITVAATLLVGCVTLPRVGYDFPNAGPLSLDLGGTWQFRLDPEERGEREGWAVPDLDDADWDEIEAPGFWERQGYEEWPGDLALSDPWEYNGAAWYRHTVRVPRQWAGRDLVINFGRVDDAARAHWNGTLLGESHAPHEDNRWTIPAELVEAGRDNVIALRVFDRGGPGGLDAGPITLRPVWPWSDLTLDLMDMPGDYVFPAGEHVDFNIRVENSLPEGFFADIGIVVTPFEREPIHDDVHGPIWINPDPDYTKALGVLLGELPAGHYDVDVTLTCDDAVVARRRRAIAVVQSVEHLDPDASPFALGGGALFHLDTADHGEEGETRLRQLEATGSVWARNDLWWGQIEPEADWWDWRKCDSVVDRFREHGQNLLAILCYDAAWSDDTSPVTPEAREEWLDYVRHMVERYGDRVRHWEVWNEPNLAEFWHPAPNLPAYIEMLRETHDAIKAIDPEAQIVGVCTSGVPLDFIRPILDAGGGAWMDALSVHPYQVQGPTVFSPLIPHGQLQMLRDDLDARGLEDLPIWITEEGWKTLGEVDHATQARYVAQFYVSVLAQGLAERIYWFNLTDWGEPDLPSGGHYGLVEIDHTPKPAYAAFNNLIARLHDFDAVEDQSDPDAGFYRFEFHRPAGHDHPEENVTVVWSEGEPRVIEIPASTAVIDLVGSPISPRPLRVGASPIYLVEEVSP